MEESTWVNALTYGTDGTTCASVAQIVFNSQEYAKDVINSDYELVLGHAANASSIAYWTPNILSTQSDNTLLTALFTSTENFNNLAKKS